MDLAPLMLANGLVSVGFCPFLLRIYRHNKKRFYLYWGTGFLLYGINIIIRAFSSSTSYLTPSPILWFAFACYMSGFALILAGNGQLIDQTKTWLASSAGMILIPVAIYLISGPAALGWVATLSPYLLTSLSLIFIRRRYPVTLDPFIVGWLTLLLVNIAIPLDLINPGYIEVLAIFSKMVIFLGMISPRFSFLEDDIKRFLISGMPVEYPAENSSQLVLVDPGEKNRADELKWIMEKVTANASTGVKTILLSYNDLVSITDLKPTGIGKDLHLVRMLPNGEYEVKLFEENVTTMTDDSHQLSLFLSEVITYSTEKNVRCDVILYTLSWIIHSNGWKKIYSNFLSITRNLKASRVNLYCIYYPGTHSDKTEIAVFEKISDRVISI